MPRWQVPNGFRAWETPPNPTVEDIERQYERGYAGALDSPEATEELLDSVALRSGEEVCGAWGYEETAKGKLSFAVKTIQDAYPEALPGPGQVEGDCVSHGQKNANLLTLASEAVAGLPDPVSGEIEELPEISADGQRSGALSTEAIYYFRSTKPGHGWFCGESASVSRTKAGCVIRQPYGDLDLTKYSKSTVNKYNRSSVPESLSSVFDDHIVREATKVNGFEALRDLVARGFGVNSCGGEGWSNKRDENGVSKRSGSWAHSMAILAVDDRAWAHEKYGGPLILVQNSWSRFNSGSRKVYGTELEIPHGSFWARWKDASKRQYFAMAGAKGWERKLLPDYSPGFR